MLLDGELAVVRAQAAAVGLRVAAGEARLLLLVLSDPSPSPADYLAQAEAHKALRASLLALTEALLTRAPPPVVA